MSALGLFEKSRSKQDGRAAISDLKQQLLYSWTILPCAIKHKGFSLLLQAMCGIIGLYAA